MRYAFSFDAASCTGCKACQVACKDKNGLPEGVLWRRVYEVSGGTWERHGAAWANTVFAYNVSVGCNHCASPACAAACPTNAYTVRADGIVLLDASRCAGCDYCAWVCPYGAPQYSVQLGRTTKCDFCHDLVDQGLPPACVAACPMRALELIELGDDDGSAVTIARTPASAQPLWVSAGTEHPFPLPSGSATRPSLAIRYHRAMRNELPKAVANRDEVRPPSRARCDDVATRAAQHLGPEPSDNRRSALFRDAARKASLQELPLVAFTLLAQAAAGLSLVALVTSLTRPVLATIGCLIAAAALVSLLHLGRATRAWRAPVNVNRSALSREILVLGVFGAAWIVTWTWPGVGAIALAATGAALVFSMAAIYRIDTVPGWRSGRTLFLFGASALLLGLIASLTIGISRIGLVPGWVVALVAVALLIQQVFARQRFYARLRQTAM